MKKRVLCLVTDGFEETELVTPVNLLRRGGVEVVMVTWDGGTATGRGGIRLLPDAEFSAVKPEDFDVLMIPGGPGVMDLLKDGRAVSLAREFHQSGRTVAAICAAPLILKEAKILEGRAFTAHFSVHGELPGVTDSRVVADGPVVTSRGPGTAVDFGLALVKLLAGEQVASEVAAGIMA